jgi:hypothetical protein
VLFGGAFILRLSQTTSRSARWKSRQPGGNCVAACAGAGVSDVRENDVLRWLLLQLGADN